MENKDNTTYVNIIELHLNRPSAVKYFREKISGEIKKGWTDFVIKVDDEQTYPNICAPIAGLLDYYRKQGIGFSFQYKGKVNSYIHHTQFENPRLVEEEIDKSGLDYPFDKVWKFNSDKGTSALVSAFCLAVRQADIIGEDMIAGIEWCLDESMDNVLQHSGSDYGYVMAQLHKNNKQFSVCVFDAGMGIYGSLKNSKHHPRTQLDAITMALQEKVTRDEGVGQGNGLWGLSNIIKDGQGYMQVTSSGAAYTWDRDGTVATRERDCLKLDKYLGTTIIDFQLNYNRNIDIAKALKYNPLDLWLENLEDENGDILIRIAEQSGGTGTRLAGEKIRNMVLNIAIADKKRVILDFNGVNLISSSYADEFLGKIISQYGIVFFLKKFDIINLTSLNNTVLNRSVQQRLAQTYYDDQLEHQFDDVG